MWTSFWGVIYLRQWIILKPNHPLVSQINNLYIRFVSKALNQKFRKKTCYDHLKINENAKRK